MQGLSSSDFKLRYRLDADAFYELLSTLGDEIDYSIDTYEHKDGLTTTHLIEPATKLAIALRFMAGGQVSDLQEIYNVSKTRMCYECVWLVADAVNKKIVIEFPIDDVEKLKV